MGRRWVVGAAVVLTTCLAITVAGLYALGTLRGVGPLAPPRACVAEVGDHRVELTPEQGRHAAVVAAVAVERDLPARAVTVALAAAYQDSGLRGRDPAASASAFYDALEDLGDYRSLEVPVAAHRVQRSAHPGSRPDAYAAHEADARALASALTGHSPEAFWCTVPDDAEDASAELDEVGLVPRARAVHDDLADRFGLPMGGFEPAGVSTGHMRRSAHYEGRAVDAFVRPVNDANRRRGWAVASYLVAHADQFAIRTVIFDDRVWRAGREGWRDYDVPSSSRGDLAILEHRDHVHVDVAR